jgi:hypothetical protein
MIGGPEKEGQPENIRFADKAGERSHVGAINVNSSSTRLLEACFLLAQYASWINDHAMPALRPVTHELAHVNERSRCRVITRLGVGCSKVSWFGRGQSQGDECQGDRRQIRAMDTAPSQLKRYAPPGTDRRRQVSASGSHLRPPNLAVSSKKNMSATNKT